jgi:hypothetical protein
MSTNLQFNFAFLIFLFELPVLDYIIYKIQSKVIQCSLVKPPPSVQSVVWRYNEFGDKLRDIENWKLCDHMKR